MSSKFLAYGLFVQILFLNLLLASDGKAQKVENVKEVSIAVGYDGASQKEVFSDIESKTAFRFVYDRKDLPDDHKISLSFGSQSVANVLLEVSRQSELSFQQVNNNINVRKRKKIYADEAVEIVIARDVSGKVTDGESGEPLPGVNVLAKGTSIGTVTDIEGQYRLSVPEDVNTLVFSSIGFTAEEVNINGRSVVDVNLKPDIQALSEVVVVGYGTQKKKDLTGSVASVNMDDVNDAPVLNAVQALQGRAAGVSVIQGSGQPGSGFMVQVRGVGSLGNTEPLYVIDGIIGAGGANSINPNDIESIEVLKDASASAIYGSRAANGVVLITTKRGKAGKPRVSLDSYYGVQQVWKKLDVLNARQYAEYANELQANGGQPAIPALQNPSALQDVTNWQDEVFQAAPIQDHNVTFSGGNESARYLFSAGYYGQEGIIKTTGFDRFSFRANSDFNIGERIEIGESFMVSSTNAYGVNAGNAGVLANAVHMPTYIPVFDPTQEGGFAGTDVEDGTDPANPMRILNLTDESRKSINILANAYLRYKILDGLNYKFSTSVDYENNSFYTFTPRYTAGERDINPFSTMRENFGTGNNLLIENTLDYRKIFGKHEVGVLAGYTRQWFEGRDFGVSVRDFPNTSTRVIGAGNEVQNASGSAADWALASLLGRVTYSYDGKYLLTANVRRDGSSRFADGNRYGVFPSFSLGWRVSDEAFMDNVSFISDMKLRYGWGQLGMQEIGLYPWQATLRNTIRYVFGEAQAPVPAITQRALSNRNISWETTTQSNFGLDLSMFEGSINMNLEYYVRRTEDMLIQVPVAVSSGINDNPTLNAGSVENRGIDVALGYQKDFGDFRFGINANAGYLLSNQVTSLGDRETPIFGTQDYLRSVVGEPIGHFFGFRMDGIYQSQAEVDADNTLAQENGHNFYQSGATAPGDIRFRDLNGDGRVTGDDREIIGNPVPKLNYGVTFNGGFKNFDFSMMLQGMSGFEMLNRNRLLQWESMQRAFNTVTTVLDRWTPENPSNTVPRAVAGDPNNNRRFSDRWMENGAFTRLKLVTLGYEMPASVLQNISKGTVSRLRMYVSAHNLLTITDFSAWDPEFTNRQGNSNNMYRGVAESVYPQARSFMIGLQADF